MKSIKDICCFEYAEVMIRVSTGLHIPVRRVSELLQIAELAGMNGDTSFFTAIAVGHRIKCHNNSLEQALTFAEQSVTNPEAEMRVATAADVVNMCEVAGEFLELLLMKRKPLPGNVAPELRHMAKTAGFPDNFTDPQIVVGLHYMKCHDASLQEVLELVTSKACEELVLEHRLN